MSKVAVVTGGTRGIGAAIAKSLLGAGYRVASTYHGNVEKAEAFKAETGIAVHRWDVADPSACQAGLRAVEVELGPVEVLVNNAGITADGMMHKMTFDQWSSVVRTNLDSMFTMTRPVIEGMRERGSGRIVNISSINGQKGQLAQVNYSAAKAGVIGFTKALALESARKGITVNCICPGYIDTDMVHVMQPKVVEGIVAQIPAGRLGTAAEIASLVVYLVSADAAFVNGAVISVNGGQFMG